MRNELAVMSLELLRSHEPDGHGTQGPRYSPHGLGQCICLWCEVARLAKEAVAEATPPVPPDHDGPEHPRHAELRDPNYKRPPGPPPPPGICYHCGKDRCGVNDMMRTEPCTGRQGCRRCTRPPTTTQERNDGP